MKTQSVSQRIHIATTWLVAACMLLPISTLADASSAEHGADVPANGHVGRATCTKCHAQEARAWEGSHHDLAMQDATDQTVLGNFDNAAFEYAGVTSRFFRRNGKFFVHTDGADGKLRDFEVKYTFGVIPLQQYLIEFPDGRLQALGIAWDTRPREAGGQRWFHLYPGQGVDHKHELHWTGLQQNWNFMCAECHSTNLQRSYDLAGNTFATSWSDIDVSCEACHGPGSEHVRWAEKQGDWQRLDANKGLTIDLTERDGVRWIVESASGNAQRSTARTTAHEIEMCARCHARRAPLWGDYRHGRPLMDTHLPQLLTHGMYFTDGQIQEEVYVYGSFLQSKMHREGVTCSDCHDPHTLKLRAPDEGVCMQCHAATKYATPAHHHHKRGSAGARCVECHMPERTYMVVDPRRDHSLRVPRPDWSLSYDTPNACTNCHTDKNAQWAAEIVEKWLGGPAGGSIDYAPALHAARVGAPEAERLLVALALDNQAPGVARATAIRALQPLLSRRSIDAVVRNLGDPDPLVRTAAVSALERFPQQARLELGLAAIGDDIRAVRLEAARQLAVVPPQAIPSDKRASVQLAIDEYIAAQHSNADRPEAHLNLGLLYAAQGDVIQSERAYRTALKLDPKFVPAYVNLADLLRAQGNEALAIEALREAMKTVTDSAELHHALALALIRQRQQNDALALLKRAAELAPDVARYSYVYGVALNSAGRRDEALTVLEQAQQSHPNDRDILFALVTMHRDAGHQEATRRYARELSQHLPDDPALRALAGE